DSLFMRRLECLGNLNCNRQCFIDRYLAPADTLGQSFPFDEFHDEELAFAEFFESVYSGNVGMVDRSKHASLTIKPRDAVTIMAQRFGKELDSNASAQL